MQWISIENFQTNVLLAAIGAFLLLSVVAAFWPQKPYTQKSNAERKSRKRPQGSVGKSPQPPPPHKPQPTPQSVQPTPVGGGDLKSNKSRETSPRPDNTRKIAVAPLSTPAIADLKRSDNHNERSRAHVKGTTHPEPDGEDKPTEVPLRDDNRQQITEAQHPAVEPPAHEESNSLSDDPPSEDQSEGDLEEAEPELDNRVEFSAFGPEHPRVNDPFQIDIHISRYSDSYQNDDVSEENTFETLVLPVNENSLIDLEFESNDLIVDAAFQRLTWKKLPLTAVFVARVKENIRDKIDCTIHIRIDGFPQGFITFDLTSDRKIPPGAFDTSNLEAARSNANQTGLGAGAVRYQSVFLSYTESDIEHVMHLAEGLYMGGVGLVVFKETHLQPIGMPWKELVPGLIKYCDAVLLCWSKNAAGKDGKGTLGIKEELAIALKEEERRPNSFRVVPILVGNDHINDVPLPLSIEDRPAVSLFHTVRRSAQRPSDRDEKSLKKLYDFFMRSI